MRILVTVLFSAILLVPTALVADQNSPTTVIEPSHSTARAVEVIGQRMPDHAGMCDIFEVLAPGGADCDELERQFRSALQNVLQNVGR